MRIRGESSVIRKTILFIAIQGILIVIVFGVYIFYSYRNIRKSMISSTENLVEVFGRELDNKIKNADMLLEQMIYKNDTYKMLQSSKEFERYYASIKLKGMMEEYVTTNQYANTCIIAESKYGTCLDYSNTVISFDQRNLLRSFIMDRAALGHVKAGWEVGTIGNNRYIYKVYVWQGEAAGVLISMDNFLGNNNTKDISNTALVLYEPATGDIWGSFGDVPENATVGNKIDDIDEFIPMGDDYVLFADKYRIKAYAKDNFNFNFLQFDMWLMLALIAGLITFTGFMIDYLTKSVIKPVGSLQKNMERVRFGDYELRIKDEFGSREFNILRDTFNKLMDEIVGLKIQSYEKQISLQETELRNIKLQIRPHFFLNAMTTISSLSQQNKNEEIRKYIDSLSKNIRYMFRAGLHTVALDEEIRHVENYFEMQELKYPGCVFYYIDAPDETRSWKIPQMFIHNVIENEYKYAVDVSNMLTILIKAEIVEKDGENMLKLEIEDDGKGYPEEIVKAFANGSTYDSTDGSRVGLWSIKRILEIMYERKDLFEIGNIEPHGCKSTMFIPATPKHEVSERARANID